MTYLDPDDFRAASLASACAGLVLEDPDDVPLSAAIARLSQRIDDWTLDHFEPEDGATLNLTGDGMRRLYLTKRCRAVASVKTRNVDGTLSAAVDTSAYRLRSSLDGTGTVRVEGSGLDWLELVWGGVGLTYVGWGYSPYQWPSETNGVEVVGDFGWAETPGDIQRALAFLVYNHFKPLRPSIFPAESVQTDTTVVRFPAEDPDRGIFSGITEADAIIAQYRRGGQSRPLVLVR